MNRIHIVYGSNGEFVFPSIAKGAIRPDDALSKEIQVDYQDINRDEKFESILR